jgi:hypothetical protein
MKFLELEGPDGGPPRSISFVGIDFKPLGYRQLADAKLHLPVTVPLDWHNAKVVETDVRDVDVDGIARGNATLDSIFSSTTVSLQRGGWLPSGLAITRRGVTVLPDRNAIGQIKARYVDGAVVAEGRDFLDMLADIEVRINPLLFALEGNGREIPSPAVVEAQLKEAVEMVARALPKATLVVGDASLQGTLGLIEDTRAGLESKQRFLLEIARSLETPTSFRLLDARWREVLEAADRNGVKRNTLVVLAALSAVAVPNSGSPGKKVLKFGPSYESGDAYNALADLRSLEILIHLLALFPNERPTIFTKDRNLALFWTGIQAHGFKKVGDGLTYDLAPVEELLPGETITRWQNDIQAGPPSGGEASG